MEKRQAHDLLKVRYRNDGDLFHELWATRRILRLLDFKSDLVAIAIEGVSEKEHSGSNEGLLVIDMTEYFGSESFTAARKIIYCQLKHSTTNPSKAWSANEISDVIEGFSKRFKSLIKSQCIKSVQEKLQFQFFTNRPISSNIIQAIQSGISGNTGLLKGRGLSALNSLKAQYGADDDYFDIFLSLLKLEGKQLGRKQQDSALKADMLNYIPEFDLNVKLRLESLIRQRMGIDFKDRPTIRKEDVLGVLDVLKSQFFPAPAEYQFDTEIFPREQENEIAKKIIHASKIVLIHASGGIGKSALTQRLAGLMPVGSMTVIFDGFFGGEYSHDRTPRHKHRYGLVQIANELAEQGLSDPLLPIPGTADSVYLQAFRLRLQQAVASIQSKTNDALLLIVLDAADNSEMAAKARHELSFIHGLLQELPPLGCKLVVLARSEPERLGLLNLPVEYEDIPLKPFSLNESALHFRQKFPDVNKQQIKNFHRLTSANPRIQAYELAQAQSISELFIQLGPTVRTLEQVIALQVDKALMHIRNEYPEKESIDRLCFALAVLPPMIPVAILAQAAKISPACIHSFVSDLKHPLLIKDEAVQFRDEPVETWFRQTYADRSTINDYIELAKNLTPLAKENTYVAITLPRVLFHAQQYDELMDLALGNAGLENEDVIARRDIVIRRVQYAMKAMLPKGYKKEVMQLILRAAEEVQSKDRQENFLIENGSLIAVLLEPELTLDLVFRKHIHCWHGKTLINRVAMLASHSNFRADASGFYRQARTWLSEWANSTDAEREDQEMDVEDIAAYALSAIHLSDAKQAVNELLRWKPKQLHFDAACLIFCELIDLAETEKITLLINAGDSRLRLLLAAATELDKIEQYLPEKPAVKAARMIIRLGSIPVNDRGYEPSAIEIGIVVIAETLAFYQQMELCLELLNIYSPLLPEHITSLLDTSRPNAFVIAIKIYSLIAALNKLDISGNDFFTEKTEKPSYEEEEKRKELKIVYDTLLPWFTLRAKVIVGSIEKQQVAETIDAFPKETGNHYGRHAYELNKLHNEIAISWLSILVKCEIIDEDATNNLQLWLNSSRYYTGIDTWTKLAKTIGHSQKATDPALIFASQAANIIESEKTAASDAANYYAELSKAVLVSDKEEARAYLSLSFEILNRLDHDNRQRLQLLFSLAQQSGQRQQTEPKEAYHLARVAELAHAYNDHKFPWPDVAVAIAELCPASSIAIFSRWRDRDLIWYGEMLPAITKHLLEKKLLPPSVLVALNAFGKHWRYAEVIETIFEQESNTEKRQQIIEILERDIELSGCEDHSAQAIIQAFKKSGNLSKKIKTKLIPLQEKYDKKHAQTNIHGVSVTKDKVDKVKKTDNQNFTSTEDIDHAVLDYKKERNHSPWETFFQHLRDCVSSSQRVKHLYALINSHELNTSLILDALKQAFSQWGQFAAIKQAMPKVTMDLLQKNGADFLTFWRLNSTIDDFSSLTQRSKPDILEIFLQTAIDHIDDISAQSLQALIIEYSKQLSADDCFEVLVFALDQFEPLLAENDGEGKWHEDKKPECSIPEAIAGMLWAFLAAPESKIRWEAAHAVRRLCQLEQREEIAALINLFNETRLPHFTDTNLPFYAMHAQLYALIAFNRAAYESPDILLPFSCFFAECALQQEFPHVQIRHFASQTALALEQYKANTYDSKTLHALKNINSSHFPRVEEKADYSHRMDYYQGEDTHFYFSHNLCEGWFHSLANVFSQTSQKNIVQKSEHWIKNIWKVNHSGSWSDDPRRNRWNRARHDETTISKYSYPLTDTYKFYLSIHAMFCIAGELLQKKPIRMGEWKDDEWGDWLRAHFLTRKDGLWLADIRDAKPKIYHSEQDENHDSKWCWSITNSLFDELLFPVTEKNNQIVVKGNIYQFAGYEQTESISINSALVKPDHAQSLLHALQTCEDPFRFGIPDAYNDLEIKTPSYKLKGWLYQPENEKELDSLDSLSGNIPYPPVLVRASVARIMGLQKSTDDKFWSCGNESIVLRSEIWGKHSNDRYNEQADHGLRFVAKQAFIFKMLKQLKYDLIIEVQIRRTDKKEHKEFDYVPGYSKLYLLKSDGSIYTLQGDYRTGKAAT